MYYVQKTLEVAGAHKLSLDYESKCSNLHGHNWIINVVCAAEELNSNGMVVDFTKIKEIVHGALDHKYINDVLEGLNPTAENIAKWICDRIPNCISVQVRESEGNTVTYARNCVGVKYAVN